MAPHSTPFREHPEVDVEAAVEDVVDPHHTALIKFLLVWTSAFAVTFLVNGAVFAVAIGWHSFWHHLAHPIIDPESYRFLAATLIGTVGLVIALFFSSALALTAMGRSPQHAQELIVRLGTWWAFPAFLYFCYVMNLLVAAAMGIPFTWLPIAVMVAAAPFALLSLAMMGRASLALLGK